MSPGETGAGIFQDNGDLVWWLPDATQLGTFNVTLVHYLGKPYLARWTGGQVLLYNQRYQKVGTVTPGNGYGATQVDSHEFKITPQNDALIGIYAPVKMSVNGHPETVVQYVVRKLSLVRDSTGIHTGSVLFEWDSIKHVRLSESYEPDPGDNGVWDYFHGNAISPDTDGNLLISARNTWGIYKINDTPGSAGYGRMMWQVGGKGYHTLAEPWCYQHYIMPLGNNRYSLYDDGGAGPGCEPGSTEHTARGVIFSVNPSQHPAGVSLVRSYSHNPAIYTQYTGSMQNLSNGRTLIDWANVPEITEYGAAGQVDMDLSLSGWSYRGVRFSWDGQPTTPPSIAAQRQGNGTTVWASWNGSTEVAAWRVLAGSAPKHLAAVGSATKKTLFETTITLRQRYADVAVQALSASGKVLSTSRTIAPS
jgi:hypothetical protein